MRPTADTSPTQDPAATAARPPGTRRRAAKPDSPEPVPGGREFLGDLVYPISPDYVTGWTTERAIAKLIANAIDADPETYAVEWSDGTLTITDHGATGVGSSGLVLGVSSKRDRDDVIGQFGEGLKIGLLVLLRDAKVSHISVDTVGFCFTPDLVDHTPLAGLAADTPVKVMSWKLHRSARTRGTVVRLRCRETVARKAMARFLHLSIPGYRPPAGSPRALLEGPGGRVYVGGVLVSDRAGKLHFSYDLSLAQSKSWQNRDRSVIDTWQLRSAVSEALVSLRDPGDITALVEATLTNTLSTVELAWIDVASSESAQFRRLLAEEGPRRWPDKTVFYRPTARWGETTDRYDDAILDLQDRGWTELTADGLSSYQLAKLAELLGVAKPKAAAARRTGNDTEWVPASKLSDDERRSLDQAVGWVRDVYGDDAVGEIRVYAATRLTGLDHVDLPWGGFYEPATGKIAVSRSLLGSDALLDIVVHEAAHRIAHRYPHLVGLGRVEHLDRTRGFEQVLHTMASRAVRALAEGTSLAELRASRAGVSPYAHLAPLRAGLAWPGPPAPPHKTAGTAAAAAGLVAAGLERWAAERNVAARSAVTAFCAVTHVKATLLRRLLAGTAAPSTPFSQVAEICRPLGVAAGVVWWAQCGAMVPHKTARPGRPSMTRYRFPRRLGEQAAAATADVSAGGPVPAEIVTGLIDFADGTVEFDGTDSWLDPIRALVSWDAAQHQSPADVPG
jgi:hypothetical protein